MDVAALRRDTPGCARVHFNAAGASLQPRPVLAAVREHLELEANLGGYEAADRAADRIADAYAAVAAVIGAQPDEIAFCESGTRAWGLALDAVDFEPGDRVLVTETEYRSNDLTLQRLARRRGIEIEVVPHGPDGRLDVEALARRIVGRVRVISVVHVPTNNGLVNPVEQLAAIDRKGALLVIDACQSLGQIPLDVAALRCDVLVATGRKYLRAPRGTGLLYLGRHVASARGLESWESNVATKLGTGAAARYFLEVGPVQASVRIAALAARLRERLRAIPGVHVLDLGDVLSGLVTFAIDGIPADAAWTRLADFPMDVTVFSDSRLAARIASFDKGLRASVHYYTSDDEIDALATAVAALDRR